MAAIAPIRISRVYPRWAGGRHTWLVRCRCCDGHWYARHWNTAVVGATFHLRYARQRDAS